MSRFKTNTLYLRGEYRLSHLPEYAMLRFKGSLAGILALPAQTLVSRKLVETWVASGRPEPSVSESCSNLILYATTAGVPFRRRSTVDQQTKHQIPFFTLIAAGLNRADDQGIGA